MVIFFFLITHFAPKFVNGHKSLLSCTSNTVHSDKMEQLMRLSVYLQRPFRQQLEEFNTCRKQSVQILICQVITYVFLGWLWSWNHAFSICDVWGWNVAVSWWCLSSWINFHIFFIMTSPVMVVNFYIFRSKKYLFKEFSFSL